MSRWKSKLRRTEGIPSKIFQSSQKGFLPAVKYQDLMSRTLENPAPFIVASLRQGCPMPSHRSPRHENVRAASDFGDTAPDAGIGAFRPSPSQGLRAGAGILIPSRRAGMEGVGMEAGMESILHPKARGWMRGWNPPSIPKGTDSRCHPNRKGRKPPSCSVPFGMARGWRAIGLGALHISLPSAGRFIVASSLSPGLGV